ncbi:FCD domain-containing protein [Arthrobacter sp. SLBN-112]|uniref:FCD domain-containing protein n=1 Tax=Arthrobacter sp. SLBN-112 TaxID=2768452 RepID=UPI002811B5B2|nr:FCD domain-containing protein [Arthrobacter sp. SLBN-112]
MRAALESLAVRTLCELPDREMAVRLLHQAVDAIEAAREASVEERIETETEFHRSLCRLTGNQTLLRSWTSLEGSCRMSVAFRGPEKDDAKGKREASPRHRDRHRNR